MAVLKFTVPGNPIPKARPRVVNGHAYTESRTELAEAWVAMHARRAKVRWTDGPVRLNLVFYRKNRVRADLNNMTKLVEDALNGVAWKDDDQVVDSHQAKHVDPENPRIEIEIQDVAPEETIE